MAEPYDEQVIEIEPLLLEAFDAEEFELYGDIDEAPLDESEEDGNDSLIVVQPDGDYYAEEPAERFVGRAQQRVTPKRKVVPFVRELRPRKPPLVGRDVRAVQRGLKARGAKLPVTGKYGDATVKAVRAFQAKRGLDADGVYGKATHKALVPAFDARAILLMNLAKKNRPSKQGLLERVQDQIEAAAIFGYNNRGRIDYSQGSGRMNGVRYGKVPPSIPNPEDCSSYSKWTYYVAKRLVAPALPDPDGLAWAPWGYTGTLCVHGRGGGKQKAALGFYGGSWGATHHVVISIGERSRCISHGSWAGPLLLDWNYRSDFLGWRVYPGVHY